MGGATSVPNERDALAVRAPAGSALLIAAGCL